MSHWKEAIRRMDKSQFILYMANTEQAALSVVWLWFRSINTVSPRLLSPTCAVSIDRPSELGPILRESCQSVLSLCHKPTKTRSYTKMLRHRALSLSEILRSIFEHLDDNLLSVCARVCKAWTDEALDCLWHKLRSLHVLLRLLAPLVWDEESEQCFFRRRIEPADWAVFQKYNARVRVLSLFRDGLHASMYTLINLRRPPIVLLPNLHRFVGDADPHVVLTFCNESVHTLHLETADYEFETSIEILLQCIPIQMPNLVDLDLDLDFTTGISKPDLSLICDMFKNLPFLKILSVLASFLLPEATHILSKHQFLESLTAFPDTAMDATFAADLNPESFPVLKDLYLSITLPRANSCLSSQFASRTLKTINIRSQPQGAEPVSGDEVDSLIKNIAHNWPALESVNISAHHQTIIYELTYLSIKPLLLCTHLTSITLEWPRPPCLTDAELVTIFKAIPCLQTLDVGHGDIESNTPRMSMASLISIAPYCPHLTHLSVFMSFHAPQDVNQVPTCSTPLTALRTLDVRSFPIEEPLMVALFFSRVLTDQCVVRYGPGENNDKWKQVASALSLLWVVRADVSQGLKHTQGDITSPR